MERHPKPPTEPLTSISSVVYNYLKEGILSGQFRSGEALRQELISKVLNVSRSPVREALNQLEREDLVILRPRRGYVVTSLSADDIEEIFEIRQMLEEFAAREATRKRSSRDVLALKGVYHELEQQLEQNPDDMSGFMALDRKFHDILLEPSGKGRVSQILNNLRDSVERYVRLELTTHTLPEVQREHKAILKAYEDGDEDEMAKFIRSHCGCVCRRVITSLSEEDENVTKQKSGVA